MLERLKGARNIHQVLQVGMHDLMSFLGAERGNIQMLGHSADLVVIAQHGLTPVFLEAFRRVSSGSASICARAAQNKTLVFVPDVSADQDFAPYLPIVQGEGILSILSFPLVTTAGDWIGMASAHFAQQANPTALELASVVQYGAELANAIHLHLPGQDRQEVIEAMAADLAARHSGHLQPCARVGVEQDDHLCQG